MWNRRCTPWILSLALLLVSTASLAGHDHGTEVERGGYDCTLDHERDHDSAASPRSTMGASGEPHRHLCPGCHYSGHRFELDAFPRATALRQDLHAPPEIRPARRASRSWNGRTLRGPPRS